MTPDIARMTTTATTQSQHIRRVDDELDDNYKYKLKLIIKYVTILRVRSRPNAFQGASSSCSSFAMCLAFARTAGLDASFQSFLFFPSKTMHYTMRGSIWVPWCIPIWTWCRHLHSTLTRSQLNLVTFLRTQDKGQNDSNRLIRLNVRVGSGTGNRAHSAHSPQIIQMNRSRASTLSQSKKTFMFFDWLGYIHR